MKRLLNTSLIFLLALANPLYGQDSFVGVYKFFENGGEELIFDAQGTFNCYYPNLNNGYPFAGKWNMINDLTVYCKLDSVIELTMESTIRFTDFICIQTPYEPDVIWCHFHSLNDSIKFTFWFRKIDTTHNDNLISVQKHNKFVDIYTNYYPNGSIHEIIEYKNGIRHGVYLEYDLSGAILKYQHWKKGKIRRSGKIFVNDNSWQKL